MTHGHPCISAFYGLNFGMISTHISTFIKIGRKITKLSPDKAIFSTKISQAWPMVTQSYRSFNGLNFGLIATHILSFIKIGRKWRSYRRRKQFFRLKSVRRDLWSPIMHIGLSMDSSLGWYLATFQVSLKLAENDQVIIGERIFFD